MTYEELVEDVKYFILYDMDEKDQYRLMYHYGIQYNSEIYQTEEEALEEFLQHYWIARVADWLVDSGAILEYAERWLADEIRESSALSPCVQSLTE